MSIAEQREMFLAKAKEADELAAESENRMSRDSWLSIAESYRNLAKTLDGVGEPGDAEQTAD